MQGRFVTVKHNQCRGVEPMDLASHFRANGSTRAGNQDTATGDFGGNRVHVQVSR